MAGTLKFATPADIQALQRATDTKLLEVAVQTGIGGGQTSNLVVRDLLPNTDLNNSGGNEYFEQSVTANAYAAPNYSGTNPDDRAFAIYGMTFAPRVSGEPRTTAIRFWDETGRTSIKDIWNVQPAHAVYYGPIAGGSPAVGQAPVVLLADAPVIYMPNRGFNIDQFSLGQGGIDHVVYLGRTVEPKGKVIAGEKPPAATAGG